MGIARTCVKDMQEGREDVNQGKMSEAGEQSAWG